MGITVNAIARFISCEVFKHTKNGVSSFYTGTSPGRITV